MSNPSSTGKLRVRLAIGGVLVTLLLAAVFTLGSLDVPFEPENWREVIPLCSSSASSSSATSFASLSNAAKSSWAPGSKPKW
jgi:hypothetical protein